MSLLFLLCVMLHSKPFFYNFFCQKCTHERVHLPFFTPIECPFFLSFFFLLTRSFVVVQEGVCSCPLKDAGARYFLKMSHKKDARYVSMRTVMLFCSSTPPFFYCCCFFMVWCNGPMHSMH
ncbi:MAG: hypothetical protein J3R72DRAFT_248062 [Linnemannia gamsii]|nr:MAG: hypothetical protein J3R72DRAFT_248062 [Linnemannia gamsii]